MNNTPDDTNPVDAFASFTEAMRSYQGGGPWARVDAAYRVLRAVLTDDDRRTLWAAAKAAGRANDVDHPLMPLYLYGVERDRRYRSSDRGRIQRKELEKRRATNPRRQEQVRAARARYAAKKAESSMTESPEEIV